MRLVDATRTRLLGLPSTSGCLSAATFAPPELTEPGRDGMIRQVVLNTVLESRRDLLREHGWIGETGDAELWRISLRVRGIDDLDCSALA
jgi:hypothetical protein